MSALTNAQEFWKYFEKIQDKLKDCLQKQDYEQLNDMMEELDRKDYGDIRLSFLCRKSLFGI